MGVNLTASLAQLFLYFLCGQVNSELLNLGYSNNYKVMKKQLINLLFVTAAALSMQACRGSYSSHGTRPIIVATPSSHHMWASGKYVYKANHYQRSSGPVHVRSRTQKGERLNQTLKGFRSR